MVIVQAPPRFTFQVDFSPGLTVGQMIQSLKDDNNLEFRSYYTVQDTSQGRFCLDDEIVMDGRIYNLNTIIVPH
jgi:hypothetical protein